MSSQDSVISMLENKRHRLVKQDSIFSYHESKSGKLLTLGITVLHPLHEIV
jgi:hypothetical protein